MGAISASCGAAAPSRHRRDSLPSDEVVGGLFFEFEAIRTEASDRDAPRRLAVDCAFGKGRHAVRASGVLRFALRRGAMGQRKARPLWVDVARAPVDVTVAGLQTGVGLLSRMARSVTGSQTPALFNP